MSHRSALSYRTVDLIVVASCLLLGLWYVYLGYMRQPAERVRGIDSIGYFVYLPSLFFDGDLDLGDDFRQLGGPQVPGFPGAGGKSGNIFSVGPALFWTPWYGLGHAIASVSGYATDGYSKPYQFCIYVGNVIYVIIGLLITARILRSFGISPVDTLIATLSVLLATQLTYYIYPKSLTSHGLSFATSAAFVLSLRIDGVTWRSGLLGGLMTVVRWQNATLLGFLAIASHLSRGKRFHWDDILPCWPYALAAIIAFLPQSLVWLDLYHTPFLIPQDEGYVDPSRLPVLEVLFSLRHGLVLWHPWWLAAAIGLIFLKGDRQWAFGFLACLLAQTVTNATLADWWGNWSFGNRRFLSSLPLFAVGIAYLLKISDRPRARTVAIGSLVVLGVWNQAFIFQYQHALIPRNNPPTWTEFFHHKFTLPTIWRAQLSVNTAVQSFRNDDFDNFIEHAQGAADHAPNFRNTLKVYSVSEAVQGRLESAAEAYATWLEIEPWSQSARWGLADIRLRLGQADQAVQLMGELGTDDREVEAALQSGEETLLTRSFFNQYRKELDQIYTE